jgi:hypothetical protein
MGNLGGRRTEKSILTKEFLLKHLTKTFLSTDFINIHLSTGLPPKFYGYILARVVLPACRGPVIVTTG